MELPPPRSRVLMELPLRASLVLPDFQRRTEPQPFNCVFHHLLPRSLHLHSSGGLLRLYVKAGRKIVFCSDEHRNRKSEIEVGGMSSNMQGGDSLQKLAHKIAPDLKGTCIFLIGMMGSEKSTVGKALAEALGYFFFDSDKLIQDASGGTNGNRMFDDEEEEGFKDAETEVLKQLSCMGRLVVATGGAIVVRPTNWSYLRHGVTVWLDVPLDTLVARVVADVADSQSLQGSQTSQMEAISRLSEIYKTRSSFYADADVIISFEKLTLRLGCSDVGSLTPAMVAEEVLEEIDQLIQQRKRKDAAAVAL